VNNFRNFAVWIIIALLLFALFNLFQSPGQRAATSEISYSQFLERVEMPARFEASPLPAKR
jgi:cell division protease FtsH